MKYRIRPEYLGQIITARIGPGQPFMTFDTSQPFTSESLEFYWQFPLFQNYIEQYEDTATRAYQGVEHPVWIPEISDTETLCTLCGTTPCQCQEPVTKPTKSRKNAKK